MLKKALSLLTGFVPDLFAGDPIPLPSPDELIAARICKLIAEDFDDWQRVGRKPFSIRCWAYPETQTDKKSKQDWIDLVGASLAEKVNTVIHNKDKSIVFVCKYDEWNFCGTPHVNGIPLSQAQGEEIVVAYGEVRQARALLEAEAARVKKEMEDNEKKWNLAEELLGMRRTKSGALVPADMLCECGEAKGHCPCVNERTKVEFHEVCRCAPEEYCDCNAR